MNSVSNQLLWSSLATGCFVVGLFFLRFWRIGRDRLFLFFFSAFWLLSLNWLLLAVTNPVAEARANVYILRLIAFVLIIIGIIDKNRRTLRS